MKHIKTFEGFLNEAHLPFDIEKKLSLGGVSFELDDDRTNEDDDNRLDVVEIYVANDKRSGDEWVIKTGITTKGSYLLEIVENEKVIFSQEYPKLQKAHFEQDCANSLGFSPELD